MSTTNFSSSRSHTKSLEELLCSLSLLGGFQQQQLICFLAVDILLCITAFDGNSLILVALHKESSLHPPSKLLYRCLATTDLLVGLVAQPLHALSWMSVVQEQWILCRYARDAAYITSHVLILVSLMTMTAITVDRLLALLLGLRYKQIVTLRRTYIIVITFRVFTLVASLTAIFLSPYNLFVQLTSYIILPGNIIRIVHKDFPHSQISSSTSRRSTTDEPNKCTEHGAIQKGSLQCTVIAVGISCLLCTNVYSDNFDRLY